MQKFSFFLFFTEPRHLLLTASSAYIHAYTLYKLKQDKPTIGSAIRTVKRQCHYHTEMHEVIEEQQIRYERRFV